MNPIDKLQKCDFTEAFMARDAVELRASSIGLYAIFSDDGQNWALDTLTGIEVTAHGLLFRRKNTLQYKHCRLIECSHGIKVIARVPGETCDGRIVGETCDGRIVGERDDHFIIIHNIKGCMYDVAKTDIIPAGDEA